LIAGLALKRSFAGPNHNHMRAKAAIKLGESAVPEH
jgi:hypothetical protein